MLFKIFVKGNLVIGYSNIPVTIYQSGFDGQILASVAELDVIPASD
jgi:hypothetical protein